MASQTRHPWKATARTILSTVVAIAAGMPLIITAITNQDAELATGGMAIALAVSGVITRLMAVPVINDALTAIGLGAEPKHKGGATFAPGYHMDYVDPPSKGDGPDH